MILYSIYNLFTIIQIVILFYSLVEVDLFIYIYILKFNNKKKNIFPLNIKSNQNNKILVNNKV